MVWERKTIQSRPESKPCSWRRYSLSILGKEQMGLRACTGTGSCLAATRPKRQGRFGLQWAPLLKAYQITGKTLEHHQKFSPPSSPVIYLCSPPFPFREGRRSYRTSWFASPICLLDTWKSLSRALASPIWKSHTTRWGPSSLQWEWGQRACLTWSQWGNLWEKESGLISFIPQGRVRGFDLSWVCFAASPLPLSRPFQWGSAVLFFFFSQPENVVWSCKCFLAVVLRRLFSSLFFGGLNLPLVTLSAPLWSPRRRLTLSLKKPDQGQTTAWLGTLPSLWSPSYGEIISKF